MESREKETKSKWIFKKEDEGTDWIDRSQDTDWWQAHVNVVMNFWVPQNSGNSSTSYFSKKTSMVVVGGWVGGWVGGGR